MRIPVRPRPPAPQNPKRLVQFWDKGLRPRKPRSIGAACVTGWLTPVAGLVPYGHHRVPSSGQNAPLRGRGIRRFRRYPEGLAVCRGGWFSGQKTRPFGRENCLDCEDPAASDAAPQHLLCPTTANEWRTCSWLSLAEDCSQELNGAQWSSTALGKPHPGHQRHILISHRRWCSARGVPASPVR